MFLCTALNNHEEDIQRKTTVLTEPLLPLSSQSTVCDSVEPNSDTKDNTGKTINLAKPKLLNQPTRRWHRRYPKDLSRDKTCPAVPIEGGKQSTPFQFEVNSREFSK